MNEITTAITEIKTMLSQSEWQQRILDCRNSGMSVKDWCRKHNIPVDSYYFHLKRLKSELEENKIVPLSLPKPSPIHDERIRIDCGNIKSGLFINRMRQVIQYALTEIHSEYFLNFFAPDTELLR